MDTFFTEKIEELREEYRDLVNEIIDLLDSNSMGFNDDEIDELDERRKRIIKEIRNSENKIPNDLQKNYFLETIDYLREKETKLKKSIREYQDSNGMGFNDHIIGFLEEILKENKKEQKQIENKISILSSNNSNRGEIKIDISPTFNQNQFQSQSINVEFQRLVQEFQSEVFKESKDPKKIKTLAKEIVDTSKEYLPFVNTILSLIGLSIL